MNLRTTSVAGIFTVLAVLSAARSSSANPPAPQGAPLALRSTSTWIRTSAPWPETLTYENRYYALNMTGLRAYLESIRESTPALYAQLDPELSRLESRRTIATGVLIGGIAVGAASFLYAFIPRDECVAPSPGDPNFAAAADAFDQCGRDRMTRMTTFSLIGLGSLGAGLLGNWLISPSRSDVLGFISDHNQRNPTPLRLQVGFDPARRSAFAGAQFSF